MSQFVGDVGKRIPLTIPLQIVERKLVLVFFDLLIVIAGVFISLYLWSVRGGISFDLGFILRQYEWIIVLTSLWFISSVITDFYDIRRINGLSSVLTSVGRTSIVAFVGYLIIYYVSNPGSVPRNIAFFHSIITFFLILLWRLQYRAIFGGTAFSKRIIILGAGWSGKTIFDAIQEFMMPYYTVVGFVDDDSSKISLVQRPPVLGTSRDLPELVRTHQVAEIVLAVTHRISDGAFRAVLDCQERGVQVTPMPVLYEQITGRVPVEHVGDNWYVALPLNHAGVAGLYPLVKRLLDLALAVAGLAVFAVMLPVLALAIKLDSEGPLFYWQRRVGKGGRSFRMLKLRSMVMDAEQGEAVWAGEDDPRVTRVGQFLRRTHLDELPQLLNILRGEMSIVGPRPERPEFVVALEQQIPFYRLRHAVKPGITGWAQLNYDYVDSSYDARLRLEYDLYYIKHQSLWLDALILVRTLGQVIRLRGR